MYFWPLPSKNQKGMYTSRWQMFHPKLKSQNVLKMPYLIRCWDLKRSTNCISRKQLVLQSYNTPWFSFKKRINEVFPVLYGPSWGCLVDEHTIQEKEWSARHSPWTTILPRYPCVFIIFTVGQSIFDDRFLNVEFTSQVSYNVYHIISVLIHCLEIIQLVLVLKYNIHPIYHKAWIIGFHSIHTLSGHKCISVIR